MPRFNFTNITLSDDADITDVMNNFNKIEQNAVLLDDLDDYEPKIIVPLEADLYLVDGTPPTSLSGYYYVGTHHVYVNNTVVSDFDNCVFYVIDGGNGTYYLKKQIGGGYQISYIAYKDDGQSNVWTTATTNPIGLDRIVTSLSSSSKNTQVPGAKLLYDQLLLKENASNKTSTINSSSTNTQYAGAKAVYDNLGIIRYGSKLSIADGSTPNLQNVRYYYINGLSVNGVDDADFSFSTIFYWSSGSNWYIDLADRYTMDGNDVCLGKRYKYDASTSSWTVVYERRLQYSTTDLTPGTSPLSTGSLYFVYE